MNEKPLDCVHVVYELLDSSWLLVCSCSISFLSRRIWTKSPNKMAQDKKVVHATRIVNIFLWMRHSWTTYLWFEECRETEFLCVMTSLIGGHGIFFLFHELCKFYDFLMETSKCIFHECYPWCIFGLKVLLKCIKIFHIAEKCSKVYNAVSLISKSWHNYLRIKVAIVFDIFELSKNWAKIVQKLNRNCAKTEQKLSNNWAAFEQW